MGVKKWRGGCPGTGPRNRAGAFPAGALLSSPASSPLQPGQQRGACVGQEGPGNLPTASISTPGDGRGRGRAEELAADPRARMAGPTSQGPCPGSHHHQHIRGQLWVPDRHLQLLRVSGARAPSLPCRRQPRPPARQPQSPRRMSRSRILRSLRCGRPPKVSPSSAASHGTRRAWTGGCTPPTSCTWTARTGRR